jgi:hypothetical protein
MQAELSRTHVVEAPVEMGELAIRLIDLGPEPDWHLDRSLFGPWRRYEAQATLPGGTVLVASGAEPWLALHAVAAGTDATRAAVRAALPPAPSTQEGDGR